MDQHQERHQRPGRLARLVHGVAATRIALVVAVAITGAACTQAGASTDSDRGQELPSLPDLEPGAARADDPEDAPASRVRLGGEPATEDLLDAVLADVEEYWAGAFAGVGLPAPTVEHTWTAPGEQVTTGCVDHDEERVVTDDTTALYCPFDDHIVISQQFAEDLRDGLLVSEDGRVADVAPGDFGVAFVVAHEYAHNVQSELLLDHVPFRTEVTELHADCWAGVWAASAYDLLEEGDIERAIATASLFGDHDVDDPGHHGTPGERVAAFSVGFVSGHPLACTPYLVGVSVGA